MTVHFDGGLSVQVFRSEGADGALVVQIDTEFEPDGSDGSHGLRVNVNDHTVPGSIRYLPQIEQL